MVQPHDRRMTVAIDPRETWLPVSAGGGADTRKVNQLIAQSQKVVTMSHRDPTASRKTALTSGATHSDHETAAGLQSHDGRLHLDRHQYALAADPRQVRPTANTTEVAIRRASSPLSPSRLLRDSCLRHFTSEPLGPTPGGVPTGSAASIEPPHVPSGLALLAIALSELARGIRGLDVLRRSVDRAPPRLA